MRSHSLKSKKNALGAFGRRISASRGTIGCNQINGTETGLLNLPDNDQRTAVCRKWNKTVSGKAADQNLKVP